MNDEETVALITEDILGRPTVLPTRINMWVPNLPLPASRSKGFVGRTVLEADTANIPSAVVWKALDSFAHQMEQQL